MSTEQKGVACVVGGDDDATCCQRGLASEDDLSTGEGSSGTGEEDMTDDDDSWRAPSNPEVSPAPSCRAALMRPARQQRLELTVSAMSGRQLAVLDCAPGDRVYEVKQRLARACGARDDSRQCQLVHGGAALRDADTLKQSGLLHDEDESMASVSATIAAKVYCIHFGPSPVASFLEALRDSVEPSIAVAASVADVVDPVMRLEHTHSERQRPRAVDVKAAVPWHLRAKLICWMVQAFDVLEFGDALLFGAAGTLDRYAASLAAPMENRSIGVALLAAICTEMKLARADQFPQGHWQRVLQHLCQGRFTLETILRMEHTILTQLGFGVGGPTPLTFFEGLCVRLKAKVLPPTPLGNGNSAVGAAAEGVTSRRWCDLGLLLLQLALLDADLQHRYPHAVLAGAALSGGIGVTGAPEDWRDDLLEDLGSYLPGADAAVVFACEEELLALWAKCAGGDPKWAEFFSALEAKFSAPSRGRVALLSPKERLRYLRTAV